jgi:hypothetical protein
MAEELDTLLDSENKIPEAEKRIKELSNKFKNTAQERDDLAKANQELEVKTAAAEKEVSFYKDFSKVSSKYPGAADHLDEIKTKVMAGYDPEDATVSVLNRAGKLNPVKPVEEKETIAGGSAATTTLREGSKTIEEMTRDEKRQALIDIENETGGISRILERKSLS